MYGVWIDNNDFNGEINSSIGQAINLRHLLINNNDFSGIIPQEICDLALPYHNLDSTYVWGEEDWKIFNISGNEFCPPFPDCIEDSLGEQDTSGCFPEENELEGTWVGYEINPVPSISEETIVTLTFNNNEFSGVMMLNSIAIEAYEGTFTNNNAVSPSEVDVFIESIEIKMAVISITTSNLQFHRRHIRDSPASPPYNFLVAIIDFMPVI